MIYNKKSSKLTVILTFLVIVVVIYAVFTVPIISEDEVLVTDTPTPTTTPILTPIATYVPTSTPAVKYIYITPVPTPVTTPKTGIKQPTSEQLAKFFKELDKIFEEATSQQRLVNEQKRVQSKCLMEATPIELRFLSPQQQRYLRESRCGTTTPTSELNYKLYQQQKYQECVIKNPSKHNLYCDYLKPIFY